MDHRYRILIVEDEPALREVYEAALRPAGHSVIATGCGADALVAFEKYAPDVVLLDINLEGPMNGFQVLGQIRQQNQQARVIIITGCNRDVDQLHGLKLDADQYVIKPVSAPVLLARVMHAMRHEPNGDRVEEVYCGVYEFPAVIVDFGRNLVTHKQTGESQELGAIERNLLWRMLKDAGVAVPVKELIIAGWRGDIHVHDPTAAGVLEKTVYRLRKKIGDNGAPRGEARFLFKIPDGGYGIRLPLSQSAD